MDVSKNRPPHTIYYAILLVGVTAVASQIVLIREFFTVFYGNELSIGFTLALWLLGGAVGSGFFGYFFADRIRKKIFLFSTVQVLISLILPSGVILARISRLLFGIAVGEIVAPHIFLVSSAAAFLPLSILLGFLFVLGCKMLSGREHFVDIGQVYTLEAMGSVIGGAAVSLVLIRYFGSFEIACILSGLNLVSSFFLFGRAEVSQPVKLAGRGIALLLVLLFLFGRMNFLDRELLKLKFSGFNVLETRDSIYGRTTVTEKEGELNFFNNGLFLFGSSDRLQAEEAVHYALIFCPDPRRVLLIGGGGGRVMSEILKYPVERVDYVELDPLIISLSRKYLRGKDFYRLDDPRVNIITEDGRFYIKHARGPYDAIIINLPNPYTARINRFYTEEFFREAKKILGENSILSFGVSSSENYLSREGALFLKSLFETAKSEFAEVEILPGDTAYFLLSPKKGQIPLKYEEIVKRIASRRIETFYVREYYLFSKLAKERLLYLSEAINKAGSALRNLDFHPISYFYDFILWSAYFSFKASKAFIFLTQRRLIIYTLGFFIILFTVFFLRRRKANFRKEATLLALATTGLSEISFEILIVLGFQIIYGYLYYKIGVIIASFMLGVSLGSFYITRRLARIGRPFRAYIFIQLLVLLYPFVLLAFFRLSRWESARLYLIGIGANLFAALPFIAGFVGGMQYPLANRIYLEGSEMAGKSAGATYAVDLLGSFLGALFLSAFFVPIVGIPNTCLLITGLNLVSLLLLLLAWRER